MTLFHGMGSCWRCYLLLSVILLSITRADSGDFKIGLLGPWDDAGSHIYPLLGSRTAGAVPLALEQIRDDGLLGNHTVSYTYRDTKCETRRASGSAVDLQLMHDVDAFIGPPCSEPCRSVRDLTAYWNKPFVSWFCPNTQATPANDQYQSFARTYVPFPRISELPVSLLDYYEWDSISLVFARSDLWELLKERIVYSMINSGVEIAQIQGYDRPLNIEAAVSILRSLKLVSHVIWLVVGGITTLESDEQIFMLAADYLDMVDGDQVFLRLELFPDPGYDTPWSPVIVPKNVTNTDLMEPSEDAMRRAYESMLLVTYRLPDDGRIEGLFERIPDVLAEPPFEYKMPNYTKVSIMSAFLYDAVLLCAHAAKYHLDTYGNVASNYTRANITFEGMTGYVMLDSAGDRIANFSLLDLKGGTNFKAVGYISGLQLEYDPIAGEEISWPGTFIPREPKCGYQGEKCLESSIITAIVVGAVLTLVVIITIPYISIKYRKYIYRKDWQIEIDELTFLSMQQSTLGVQGYPSMCRLPNVSERLLSHQTLAGRSFHQDNAGKAGETKAPDYLLAKYKSETVVLRKAVLGNNLSLNKATKKELKEMRWLLNENLTRFVGVCFPTRGGNDFYYISEYCTKGNLKNILANDDIKLDLSFKVSFIKDLARGMQFLHNSVIKSHGLLCSNLCYLDSRWVLKIAGFGVVSFHMSKGTGEKIVDPEARFGKLLWTSPELLRHELPPKGSQKGDVYSFGILIEEILSRSVPYQEAGLSSKVIIRRVMKREEPPFRPQMTASTDDGLLTQLSQSDGTVARLTELRTHCWEEHPEDRPDFNVIRHRLRAMQRKGKELNLMDSMVEKMEKYTENLEHVVANRTAQLLEEKKKTDALLYRMLPQAVADELKKGQLFPGEFYDQVTLYFSDIVGFTELSAMSTPMQVVDFLNDLYTCFDAILETFDVYKVETIGDAYMVASGLPRRNGNRHASEIASMALAVREGVKNFKVRHLPERKVQIRIGINSGSVAAGVVGLMMPRFCLFGDTVNTASRMESHGLPQRIHVSCCTASLLTDIGGYRLEVRGQMKIKGKGMMTTFWLLGKDEQFSAATLQDSTLSYSVKKISTDTVVSEDSLLSPSNNDLQDVIQNSLIVSRVPEEELPSDLGCDLSSPASSPRKRRTGNGNANHDFSRQDRTDIPTDTFKAPGNSSLRISNEVKEAGTPQYCSDIRTIGGTLDRDMSTKTDDVTSENCDIRSTSADITLRDGEYVRTQNCVVVQTLSGDTVTSPATKRPPSHLVSCHDNSTNLPNVPSLPDIMVNNDVLSETQQNSVYKYTVPLPQLMSEISPSAQESSSVNTTEFNHNTDFK